eukprot:m.131103 g.131103  ORF g.131103 m.131103 type:complete len:263 (+) comp15900_c0_seq2:1115-1903(+)
MHELCYPWLPLPTYTHQSVLLSVVHSYWQLMPSLSRDVYTQAVALRWAKHIAAGMQYLHDHDVIHRDLKSPNVLLTYLPTSNRSSTADPDALQPKSSVSCADDLLTAQICDFGLAVPRSSVRPMGRTSKCNGTISWMAPESMMSLNQFTSKVDVFSYGVVLYELVTRLQPYAGMEPVAVVYSVCSSAMRPDTELTVPDFLPAIDACWKQLPEERPDFAEVQQLLREVFLEPEARIEYHGPEGGLDPEATLRSNSEVRDDMTI